MAMMFTELLCLPVSQKYCAIPKMHVFPFVPMNCNCQFAFRTDVGSLPDIFKQKMPVGFFSWGFHNMIASGNLKLNCPSDPDFWSCWLPLFLAWYQPGMNLSCAILVPRVFLWDVACSHVWCNLSGVQLMTMYVLWCYNHSKWHSSSQPFQDIFDACRNKELLWTDLLVLLLLNYCMYIFFFWKKNVQW